MTDKQAEELLLNNNWTKFSDARELLQEAAHIGAMEERKNLEAEMLLLKEENERLRGIVPEFLEATNDKLCEVNDILRAQRDLLLEALRQIVEQHGQWNNGIWAANIARAAIKAAKSIDNN